MFAHTAIHIFNRALQNQGLNIFVRKAEDDEYSGKVWIQPKINIENIFAAEKTVNEIIEKDLSVSYTEYNNLNEALKNEPKLRYNYQRISENEKVRVVKIGDFDVAACIRNHVSHTRELIAFFVTSINYSQDETEISYLVGEKAIEFALNSSNILLSIRRQFNFKDPLEDISRLEEELKSDKKALVKLVEEYLKLKGFLDIPIEIDKNIREAVVNAANYRGIAVLFSNDDVFAFSQNKFEELSKKINSEGLIKGLAKENIISGKTSDKKRFIQILSEFKLI